MRSIATASLHTVRRSFGYAPWLTVLSAFVVLALASVPALQVVLVARLVGAVSEPRVDRTSVLVTLAGVAVVASLLQPLGEVSRGLGYRLVSITRARLHEELTACIAGFTPSMIADPKLQVRVTQVRDSIPMHVGYMILFLEMAVEGIVSAIGLCVAIVTFDPLAGILVLLSVVPVLVASQVLANKQERMDPELADLARDATYYENLLVYQRSAAELAVLGTSGRVARWAAGKYHAFSLVEARLLPAVLTSQASSGVVTGLLLAGALLAVVLGGQGGAGVAAGIVGALSGAGAMRGAGYSIGAVVEAAPKVVRFRRLTAEARPQESVPVKEYAGTLTASHLTHSYGQADGHADGGAEGQPEKQPEDERSEEPEVAPALDDVSVTVRKGEMVALVGPNGAGKTTLVNCLLGVLHPARGEVTLDGLDLAAMPEPERLSYFGVMTQDYGRFELPVRDAVMLGHPDENVSDEQVWEALRQARADDLVKGIDGQLDARLGEQWNGVGLSGGEWQRVALARVILRNAPIWILDEPTSAIDAETEQVLFAALAATKEERATVVVSHRAWTLRDMDRIHVLDHGRIVESGTFGELLAARGRFFRLFREQTSEIAGTERDAAEHAETNVAG